jgi:choice-of-anchor C domain-containing protein
MRYACLVAVLGFVLAGAGPAMATSVTNGSFELGTSPPTVPFKTLSAGNTDINGWQVTYGAIDWIYTYWQAQDGSRSLDLSGTSAGAIKATTSFDTVVNNWYEVDFWMSGNPVKFLGQKDMQVSVTMGTVILTQNFSYDTAAMLNTVTDMKWVQKSFTFQAESDKSMLGFTSLTNNACGPALDNVSVKELAYSPAVPEPVTMAGLAMGIGGLVAYVRRRRTV